MKMKAIVFLSCVVLGCLPLAASYPNGAPDTACRHMFPLGHNKDSQMSTPPYSVEISRKDYKPGSNVTVIIRAKFGIPFRGFFLQARNAECKTENAEGHFYTDETDAKLMPCPVAGSWKNNSVTHTSKNEKLNKTFIWNNKKGGDVFFQATIVKEKTIFWAGVQSDILMDQTKTHRFNYSPCPARTKIHMYPTVTTAAGVHVTFSGVLIALALLLGKYI